MHEVSRAIPRRSIWAAAPALALCLVTGCGPDETRQPSRVSTGGSGGVIGSSSSSSGGGGGSTPAPEAVCASPLTPVDTSSAKTVVGSGTKASCTEAALRSAIEAGGVVTFDCGADPLTIVVGSELVVTQDTVLDGGGLITLSGAGKTRILHLASAWDQVSPRLVVQRARFTRGYTTDAPDTKATDKGGSAIFREGGTLDVIECTFDDNHGPSTGQDVSGGAITSQGVGNTTIASSTFRDNSSSNGGAVGNLGNGLSVINSVFENNAATGNGGNPGNGGNGGAIVFDGADTALSICGSTFRNNSGGAIGGALFRVAYNMEPTIIDRSTFDSNFADPTDGLAGAIYLQQTTITMSATTIANNSAHYGGGFWVGQSAVANLTNVTITDNHADQGGGLWFAGDVSGTFSSTTIADNHAGYGSGLFAGENAVVLENSIIVNNDCKNGPLITEGTNLESSPDLGCAPGALVGEALLGPLQDNGGPTPTRLPAATSDAVGLGVSCPPTDQRGVPRVGACTLGAVQVD